MKLVAAAIYCTCVLVFLSCAGTDNSSPDNVATPAQASPAVEDSGWTSEPQIALADQTWKDDSYTSAHENARELLERGDKTGAKTQVRAAIEALLAEGRMNAGDARIDVLARLSILADRLGDMDAADRAWKRVCLLRTSSYYSEADHLALLKTDKAYRLAYPDPQVLPSSPTPAPPADPTQAGAQDATGKVVPATAAKGTANEPGGSADEQERNKQAKDKEARHKIMKDRMTGVFSVDVDAYMNHSEEWRKIGDDEAADEALDAAVELAKEKGPTDDPDDRAAQMRLAKKLSERAKYEPAAADTFKLVVTSLEHTKPSDDPERVEATNWLGATQMKLGRFTEANATLAKVSPAETTAAPEMGTTPTAGQTALGESVLDQANKLEAEKNAAEAEKLARALLGAFSNLTPDADDVVKSKTKVAEHFAKKKQYGEALRLRREILAVVKHNSPNDDAKIIDALEEVSALLRSDLNKAEAREVDKEIEERKKHLEQSK